MAHRPRQPPGGPRQPRGVLRLRTGARAAHPVLRAERQAFGPSTLRPSSTRSVSRDIPFIRLDRHSLVQFGHGVHQQRIRATMTSQTSAIGVDIASDKSLTNRLLDSAGLPVPRSEVVQTEEDTVTAAKRLGFPCVVKPLDGNHGRGVHLDLRSEEAVRAAFKGALAESRSGDLVVETYVAGNDYRCLVIGGKMAAHRGTGPGLGDAATANAPCASWCTSPTRTRARHRPREGADPDQDRRRRRSARQGPGLRARWRPARRHLDQACPDRQYVDRWDVHRPDHRGPPRQRRDRRDGRPDRRPGRGRHRLHLPRHRDARARDGRCHRRGQRGARVPDAHQPDRGRAAVRRPTGHRFAVPVRHGRPASRSSR